MNNLNVLYHFYIFQNFFPWFPPKKRPPSAGFDPGSFSEGISVKICQAAPLEVAMRYASVSRSSERVSSSKETTRIYICIYIYIYKSIYVCTCICICVYLYIIIYICMHVYTCIYIYVYIYICIYMHIYI